MTDGIPLALPLAHTGIIGKLWTVEGVGTFRCVTGKVEVINGVKYRFPETWELIEPTEEPKP